jgi:predicted transcriptional regulator
MTLTTYEQLRAISDPLRSELLMMLLQKPYTGQQLSEQLNISRAKIHYHLKELEKNGLIEIIKKEEKNGIVQKFYQSVARGFTASPDLLPHSEEIDEAARQIFFRMLEKTKSRVLSAPSEAFLKGGSERPSDWNHLGSIFEIRATEEQFQEFIKKFFTLVNDFDKQVEQNNKDANVKLYHVSAYGFQVDTPMFEEPLEIDEE